MGPPTLMINAETGSRLIYARGPYGRHTYFVDFDHGGKLMQHTQVLTEENFKKILPEMTATDVERILGPSLEKRGLARNRGAVWAYRFETTFCIWFEIEFSAEGIVRSAGFGIPPECHRSDRSLPSSGK